MRSITTLTNDSFPGSEIRLLLPTDDYPWWSHAIEIITHTLWCFGWRKV